MAEICKKQRAAACGAHVLFNAELLREEQPSMDGFAPAVGREGGETDGGRDEEKKMNFSLLLWAGCEGGQERTQSPDPQRKSPREVQQQESLPVG